MLLENTRMILDMVRERRRIARVIAAQKLVPGFPVRDRDRELAVLSELGEIREEDHGFLSMLFEYTIQEELAEQVRLSDLAMEDNPAVPRTIRGEFRILSFIAGLLMSSPGVEFDSEIRNESLFDGIAVHGGHIISKTESESEQSFCIASGGKCLVEVKNSGVMKIGEYSLTRRQAGFTFQVVSL